LLYKAKLVAGGGNVADEEQNAAQSVHDVVTNRHKIYISTSTTAAELQGRRACRLHLRSGSAATSEMLLLTWHVCGLQVCAAGAAG
jgi:hypothetical protein